LLTTALRETEEEIGVPRGRIEVWGALDHSVITVSEYRITPFVGYTPERPEFHPDPEEVAEILEVPLSLLTNVDSMREELRELRGAQRLVSFYPWGPHKIWGATARVLAQLAQRIDAGARQPHEL
jgi:8-oxo-dGTP pyrophosphatase MutT (NUDIX family)